MAMLGSARLGTVYRVNDASALPVGPAAREFCCVPRMLVRYDAQIDRREGRGPASNS
jgi:hypothetical protein